MHDSVYLYLNLFWLFWNFSFNLWYLDVNIVWVPQGQTVRHRLDEAVSSGLVTIRHKVNYQLAM